jgi:hypothetical protein
VARCALDDDVSSVAVDGRTVYALTRGGMLLKITP